MKKLLLTLLAIFLIIEEWLWDLLLVAGHYLVVVLKLQNFERWLSQTSPNLALLTFLIPILIVTPINLAAFWLLLNGLIQQGVLLEILAKLLGTLLVARVFSITKPQLLTFSIIAFVYTKVSTWLKWAHAKIINTAIYRYSKQLKASVKARVQAFFR
jgi:hypothetical protein